MLTLKVTEVGSATAIMLDEDALTQLGVRAGDLLCLTQTSDGGYRITPYSPEFARQMELVEQVMRKNHDVLRALAK